MTHYLHLRLSKVTKGILTSPDIVSAFILRWCHNRGNEHLH